MARTAAEMVLKVVAKDDGAIKDLRSLFDLQRKLGRDATRDAETEARRTQEAEERRTASRRRQIQSAARYEFETQRRTKDEYLRFLREQEQAEEKSYSRRLQLLRERRRLEDNENQKRRSAGAFVAGAAGAVVGGLVAGISEAAAQKTAEFLSDSTRLASDLNETLNATTVAFGRNADQVVKWSENSAEALGTTQQAALQAASGFALMLKQAGVAGDQVVKLSEDLVQRAVDLTSVFNTPGGPEETLKALESGLAGQTEVLRRFGIFIDDDTTKAEAFALGLGKIPPNMQEVARAHRDVEIAAAKSAEAVRKYGEGSIEAASAQKQVEIAQTRLTKALSGHNSQLSQTEKLQARVSIVLKQSQFAMGDFAKTANQAANQERILNAEIAKLQTQLGQELLPMKRDVTAFFLEIVKGSGDAVEALGRFMRGMDAAHGVVGQRQIGQGSIFHIWGDEIRMLTETLHLNNQTARQDANPLGRRADLAGEAAAYTNLLRRGGDATQLTPELASQLRKRVPNMAQFPTPAEFQGYLRTAQGAAQGDVNAIDNQLKQGRENETDAEINRRIQAAVAARKAAGTGGIAGAGNVGATSGGGLYSGAARNAESGRAESAARKAARDEARQQAQLSKLLADTQVQAATDAYREALRGIGGVHSEDALVKAAGVARGLSGSLYMTQTDTAKRLFAGNTAGEALARQRASGGLVTRRDAIQEAIDAARRRIATEARKQADEAQKQREQQEKATEQGARALQDFLDAEQDRAKIAFDSAEQDGRFRQMREQTQIIADNLMRQANARYEEALHKAFADIPEGIGPMQAAGLYFGAVGAARARRAADMAGIGQTVSDLEQRTIQAQYNASPAGISMAGNATANFATAINSAREIAEQTKRNTEALEDIAKNAGKRPVSQDNQDLRDQAAENVRQALEGRSSEAARGLFKGDTREFRDAIKGAGRDLGDIMADTLARKLVTGPLEKLADKWADKIVEGSNTGALALKAAVMTAGQILGKKVGGNAGSAITGAAAGYAIGGPVGAAIGGGLGLLGIKLFGDGGNPSRGEMVGVGERGTELSFSQGRVAALTAGLYRSKRAGEYILPHDQSQRVLAAAGVAGGGGTGGNTLVYNHYGDVNDRADRAGVMHDVADALETSTAMGRR